LITSNMINQSDEKWLVWCNLNDESQRATKLINNSVEVTGSDTQEHKEKSMFGFTHNEIKCLVTKPRIAGFGMNWQNCNNVVFLGLSDSYEQFYQAVRRCWRYGQDKPVNVYIVIGEREVAVLKNIKRKESDMQKMSHGMIHHMKKIMQSELFHTEKKSTPYNPQIEMKLPNFLMEVA
jgi:hypothetical protein